MTELPSPSLMTVVTCNDDDDNVYHNYDDGDQTDDIKKVDDNTAIAKIYARRDLHNDDNQEQLLPAP